MAGDNHKIDNNKNDNKTKVLSVQLGKTLCLTKVPITETEESTQVREKKLFKTCLPHQEGSKRWV